LEGVGPLFIGVEKGPKSTPKPTRKTQPQNTPKFDNSKRFQISFSSHFNGRVITMVKAKAVVSLPDGEKSFYDIRANCSMSNGTLYLLKAKKKLSQKHKVDLDDVTIYFQGDAIL
jgi:hypothetical protein